jgi:dTDP-4-amino-4,6-dideoxygalactose transaminase
MIIPVTKPFLPPREEYEEYLKIIWERNWLTNNGPLVNELELKLKEYLNIKHLLFVSNGTIAIQLAIKALDIKSEIITTPFSYVATTSSIVWEGCTPVFVDIDPLTLNIDPSKIEHAITERTSAIVATHVYGNPCDVEGIDKIAKKHNLKVIYDGAHAFGVKLNAKSILEYGDISTTSFHATKLFHTIEGGAVFTKDPALLKRMALMRNFGHDGPEKFSDLGINCKNCEFHAAMGLVNLNYIKDIIKKRKVLSEHYKKRLKRLKISYPLISEELEYNYAYFPIIFETEEQLLRSKERIEVSNILTRRYFYPSLNKLPYVSEKCMPLSEGISKRILCLPLYNSLTFSEIDMICRLLLRIQNYE